MANGFYNDFDRQELDPRDPDYRSVFQRGRDRLSRFAPPTDDRTSDLPAAGAARLSAGGPLP